MKTIDDCSHHVSHPSIHKLVVCVESLEAFHYMGWGHKRVVCVESLEAFRSSDVQSHFRSSDVKTESLFRSSDVYGLGSQTGCMRRVP